MEGTKNSRSCILFTRVCLNHISQIKKGLGIAGVSTEQSSWIQRGDNNNEGTQIDLIIKRKDNIYNLCEIKFYSEEFTVDKSYHAKLVHRKNLFPDFVTHKIRIL